MTAAKCQFCGSTRHEIRRTLSVPRYWVKCSDCGAEGPSGISATAAVNRWNRRVERIGDKQYG